MLDDCVYLTTSLVEGESHDILLLLYSTFTHWGKVWGASTCALRSITYLFAIIGTSISVIIIYYNYDNNNTDSTYIRASSLKAATNPLNLNQ